MWPTDIVDRDGSVVMIPPELVAEIRRLYHAEHWKVGTIAAELHLHYDTVRRALAPEQRRRPAKRKTKTAPYLEFIQQTLEKYPRLRATRIHEMIRQRGYTGGIAQVRRLVRRLRPRVQEAFVRLEAFPGEQAQVDWAHFGLVRVGQALRRLSGLVLTLAYSRAFYLEFFFDQCLENFLTAHVRAFHDLGGCTRSVLYDNMKSVVLERYAERARFHPKLLELCAHYHFQPRLCHPYRGNEKGRVERTIRFIREGFIVRPENLGRKVFVLVVWTSLMTFPDERRDPQPGNAMTIRITSARKEMKRLIMRRHTKSTKTQKVRRKLEDCGATKAGLRGLPCFFR